VTEGGHFLAWKGSAFTVTSLSATEALPPEALFFRIAATAVRIPASQAPRCSRWRRPPILGGLVGAGYFYINDARDRSKVDHSESSAGAGMMFCWGQFWVRWRCAGDEKATAS